MWAFSAAGRAPVAAERGDLTSPLGHTEKRPIEEVEEGEDPDKTADVEVGSGETTVSLAPTFDLDINGEEDGGLPEEGRAIGDRGGPSGVDA